jgi:hypothetical protein
MLASGQGTQAQALLLRRFRDTAATADHSASARRAAELLEAADARMLERKRAEEERRREQQRHRAAAKAQRTPSVWMTSRPREMGPGNGSTR